MVYSEVHTRSMSRGRFQGRGWKHRGDRFGTACAVIDLSVADLVGVARMDWVCLGFVSRLMRRRQIGDGKGEKVRGDAMPRNEALQVARSVAKTTEIWRLVRQKLGF